MVSGMVSQWAEGWQARREDREQQRIEQLQDLVEDCYQTMRAIESWDRVIQDHPQDARAYSHRALAFTLLGRNAEAREDIERAALLGLDRRVLVQEARAIRGISLDPSRVEALGRPTPGYRFYNAGLVAGFLALLVR